MPQLSKAEPADIAACIFGEAGAVAADSIYKGRHTLTRMLNYMETCDLCFDDSFGTLPEVDLYGFLLTVHHTAVLNGTDRRPGFTAVWGVFNGLVYLKNPLKFPLPTDEVRNALLQRGNKKAQVPSSKGTLALSPEAQVPSSKAPLHCPQRLFKLCATMLRCQTNHRYLQVIHMRLYIYIHIYIYVYI